MSYEMHAALTVCAWLARLESALVIYISAHTRAYTTVGGGEHRSIGEKLASPLCAM